MTEPAPPRSGQRATRLTLLYRAYCHLCDEMLDAARPLAAERGVAIDVVDLDAGANAGLEAEWGDRVPVLFLGPPEAGNELCHYRFDADRVSAALGATGAFASEANFR